LSRGGGHVEGLLPGNDTLPQSHADFRWETSDWLGMGAGDYLDAPGGFDVSEIADFR
jgi:hypothetical protein